MVRGDRAGGVVVWEATLPDTDDMACAALKAALWCAGRTMFAVVGSLAGEIGESTRGARWGSWTGDRED